MGEVDNANIMTRRDSSIQQCDNLLGLSAMWLWLQRSKGIYLSPPPSPLSLPLPLLGVAENLSTRFDCFATFFSLVKVVCMVVDISVERPNYCLIYMFDLEKDGLGSTLKGCVCTS